MTPDEIRALPAAVDIVTAGRALGIGRTLAHELARGGKWPTPLLRLGTRYRVRRSDLLELLGIEETGPPPGRGPGTPTAEEGVPVGDRDTTLAATGLDVSDATRYPAVVDIELDPATREALNERFRARRRGDDR